MREGNWRFISPVFVIVRPQLIAAPTDFISCSLYVFFVINQIKVRQKMTELRLLRIHGIVKKDNCWRLKLVKISCVCHPYYTRLLIICDAQKPLTDDDDNDIMWCEIYYRISQHKSSVYCILLVNKCVR